MLEPLPTRLAELADRVHEELADPTVAKRDDVAALQQHDVLRRVVWLTEGGQIDATRQAGGALPDDGTQVRITACRIRGEEVQAHLYAEDRATTEQLLDNTIAAVCLALGPSATLQRYRWLTEERAESGRTRRSVKCILYLTMRLPVPELIEPLLPLPPAEVVCGLIDADGDFVPVPEDEEP